MTPPEFMTPEACERRHREDREQFQGVVDRNSAALQALKDAIIDQYAKSLPVKEVMKLFTFFALLVLFLVGGIRLLNAAPWISGAVADSSSVQHAAK